MPRGILRSFGGKGSGGLLKFIYKYIPFEDGSRTVFVEPFAGGASVFFALPEDKFPIRIINDLNQNIYNLYKVLSDKKLYKKMKQQCDILVYSEQLWKEYKDSLKNDTLLQVDRAVKFLYVNRTSVNSIGGFSMSINVIRKNLAKPVRDLLAAIESLPEIHEYLSTVTILNQDAVTLIPKYDNNKTFMYLDSPYHQETRTAARYPIDMSNIYQKEYIDTLLKIKHAKIMVSAYKHPEYDRLVSAGWNYAEQIIHTQSGSAKPKNRIESLYMNY